MNDFNKLIVFPLVLSLSAFLQVCSKGGKPEPQDSTLPVAVVNGEGISSNDFIVKAEEVAPALGINLDVYQERRKLLDQIIAMQLVYQKAKAEGFEKGIAYREFLAAQYLKNAVPSSDIPEEDIAKYYEKNKNTLDEVRVAHILVKPAKPKDPESEKEAQAKAANILLKALNGEDFAKLAMENSEDKANAGAGGDLGFFTKGMMVKEFEEAAFSLKTPGDLSKVVKTQFGYHILKLLDSRRGLDAMRDRIKKDLKLAKEKDFFDSLVEGLRKKADIKVYEDNLKNVKIVNEEMLTK